MSEFRESGTLTALLYSQQTKPFSTALYNNLFPLVGNRLTPSLEGDFHCFVTENHGFAQTYDSFSQKSVKV